MPFISTLPAIKTYSAVVVNTPSFFFSVITLVGWRDRIVCTNSALRLNYQQVHETISFIFWFNLFFLVGRLHFLFFIFEIFHLPFVLYHRRICIGRYFDENALLDRRYISKAFLLHFSEDGTLASWITVLDFGRTEPDFYYQSFQVGHFSIRSLFFNIMHSMSPDSLLRSIPTAPILEHSTVNNSNI